MKHILRLVRTLRLDGNPLRRGVDRLESGIILGLLAAFLICAPLLAIAAGQWAHRAGQDQQHAQRAWHQTSAVVLRSEKPPTPNIYTWPWDDVQVPASWTAPGGLQRTGDVLAAARIRAGQTVRIWVDESGLQTGPPLSASQLAMRVTGATALTPAFLAVALLGIGGLAHWLLNRRKLAAWESDWAYVEPQWTRHR
jgi:Protein of unknown function (DUF3592)